MPIPTLLLYYLLALSLAAFAVCGWDKRQARLHRRRVPERTLLLLCALGGAPGFGAGMLLFHHKTRKPKFYMGVPAILLAQGVLIWQLFFR